MAMDEWLLLSQNKWAGWGYWPDYVAWFLAVWGLAVLMVLLLLRWLFPQGEPRRERHTVLLAAGATVLAIGAAQFPVLFFYRQRPYVAVPGAFDLLGCGPSPSFPSKHAVAAFALAWVMGWESRRWGWLTWPVALGIAWARVYAGVHYPSDMLASLVIAFLVGWMLVELRQDLEPALDRVLGVLARNRVQGRR